VEVILAACAVHYFRGQVSGYRFNEQELWHHSVATALMAEKLAQEFRKRKVLTAYTAGLLHDIGKTVLDLYAKIYLHIDLSQIRKAGIQFIEAERRALGIDHQELGQIIARRWQFPGEVTVAIGNHHFPQKAKTDQDMAAIVYAADRMVNAMEGEEEEGARDVFDPASDPVFKAMGIDAQRVETLQAELAEALEGIVSFLKNDA
jgi:putative nucleotidyltransferase with HDIG domain